MWTARPPFSPIAPTPAQPIHSDSKRLMADIERQAPFVEQLIGEHQRLQFLITSDQERERFVTLRRELPHQTSAKRLLRSALLYVPLKRRTPTLEASQELTLCIHRALSPTSLTSGSARPGAQRCICLRAQGGQGKARSLAISSADGQSRVFTCTSSISSARRASTSHGLRLLLLRMHR